jgi:hypothetical protein
LVWIISTENYSILVQITMNGSVAPDGTIMSPAAANGIERCQWDRCTGKFYVNIGERKRVPGNDTQPGAVDMIPPKTCQMTVCSIPVSKRAGP